MADGLASYADGENVDGAGRGAVVHAKCASPAEGGGLVGDAGRVVRVQDRAAGLPGRQLGESRQSERGTLVPRVLGRGGATGEALGGLTSPARRVGRPRNPGNLRRLFRYPA